MNTTWRDYRAALKAVRCRRQIDLSNSEWDACNIIIADYTCGGKTSFKPTKREIATVHSAAARV